MKLHNFILMMFFFVMVFTVGLIAIIIFGSGPLLILTYILIFPILVVYCLYRINEHLRKRIK